MRTSPISWRPTPTAGRIPTSFLIEAGSFPLGSNLAQLTFPSSGSAVKSFSVAAPPGAYWVRMRGGNDCGVGPTSQEVLVLVGQGISSLTGRWKGLGRVQCAADPLCRVRGEILWPLDLDLQQTGNVVTGTYYFQAVDAPTTAPEAHLQIWHDAREFFRVGGRRDWAALLDEHDLDHFHDRLNRLAGDAAPWILTGRAAL